jgi:ABC-type glycerol-3-phosphate transport system substrate-binding protein
MAKLWNEQNPDRQIKFVGEVLPYEDMHTKLLVSLQAGTGAPDIVDIEIAKYPNFLKGNIQLAPLNDVIDPVRDKFVTARLDIYSKDGKNYGLPFHVGASRVAILTLSARAMERKVQFLPPPFTVSPKYVNIVQPELAPSCEVHQTSMVMAG